MAGFVVHIEEQTWRLVESWDGNVPCYDATRLDKEGFIRIKRLKGEGKIDAAYRLAYESKEKSNVYPNAR